MVHAESPELKLEWKLSTEEMDQYLAEGWRHFGPILFRYKTVVREEIISHVQPLRVVLERFSPSKSQRRILRRNADLQTRIQTTAIDDELRLLFESHKVRFREDAPDSLEDVLGQFPEVIPCENIELSVWKEERKIAASFVDLGRESVSSVYAIFEPAEARRSLGILTMLLEMDFARERGCRFYYPGYAYDEPSHYDYKKRFKGMERFDWQGNWVAMERVT